MALSHLQTKLVYLLLILVNSSNQTAELDFKEDTGLFLVLYNNKWHTVCYHGDPNTWGKREAIVTCRQLGYKGGWPLQIQQSNDSYPHLYNFDCDGTELDIKSCSLDLATSCRNSKLAGIQCYGSFKIRIVDGPVESAGNIEVQYDNTWSAVCYISLASETRTWTFQNAQVVCKELGYPGTMITRQGGIANGSKISSVDGFKCREDLRDPSLSECLPDTPQTRKQIPSCGLNNEAVVMCAGPGYVGCYNTNNLKMFIQISESQNMTTQFCRKNCMESNFTHAYLSSGNTCSCGDGVGSAPISDIRCRVTCSGDENQVCGDEATASVYDVKLGTCTHPNDTSKVYYYGDIVVLPCGPDMESGGTIHLQCVSNSSITQNGLVWIDVLSKCTPKESWSTLAYPLPSDSVSDIIVSRPNPDEGIIVSRPNKDEGEKARIVVSVVVFVVATCMMLIVPFLAHFCNVQKTRKTRQYIKVERTTNQDEDDEIEPLEQNPTSTNDVEIGTQTTEEYWSDARQTLEDELSNESISSANEVFEAAMDENNHDIDNKLEDNTDVKSQNSAENKCDDLDNKSEHNAENESNIEENRMVDLDNKSERDTEVKSLNTEVNEICDSTKLLETPKPPIECTEPSDDPLADYQLDKMVEQNY